MSAASAQNLKTGPRGELGLPDDVRVEGDEARTRHAGDEAAAGINKVANTRPS